MKHTQDLTTTFTVLTDQQSSAIVGGAKKKYIDPRISPYYYQKHIHNV